MSAMLNILLTQLGLKPDELQSFMEELKLFFLANKELQERVKNMEEQNKILILQIEELQKLLIT